MNQKKTIKCSECEHCDGYRRFGNIRTEFSCIHPDQAYIKDFFSHKKIYKMPGFLGFSAGNSNSVPVKTSPAWCPKKKSQNNI